jgi:hypothetical protein
VREICTLGLKRRGLETNSGESGASPRPYITSLLYYTAWRFPGSPACEPSFCNWP